MPNAPIFTRRDPLPQRRCSQCGEQFQPRNRKQVYCPPPATCRERAKNYVRSRQRATRRGDVPVGRRVVTVFDRNPTLLAECSALLDAALDARKGGTKVRGAAKAAAKEQAA